MTRGRARRPALALLLVLLAACAATDLASGPEGQAVVDVPRATPVPGALADLPTGTFVALPLPERGRGIPGEGMKHVTWAHNPLDARLYATGGDYSGGPASFPDVQSYRQETWSLSVAERWATRHDRNAGWRLEYPYCGLPGQLQPKHPDFVGWTWDPRRQLFWLVPGVMEISYANCPGETSERRSDPTFPLNAIMTFDPRTKTWVNQEANGYTAGPDPVDTWMSVYDPVRDELTRFGSNGAHGGVANILNITTKRWTVVGLGSGVGGDIRINKEYLAPDLARRQIYVIDGWTGRLYRWSMDGRNLADLGPVPGGTMGAQNLTHPVWDSVNNVLLWHRTGANTFHVYRPDLRRWESPAIVASPPDLRLLAQYAVFDPPNNVLVLRGSVEPTNPYLFLYRYSPPMAGPGPVSR